MTTCILDIPGRTTTARMRKLEKTRRRMERRGWELVDYSDPIGSALFGRAKGAPPLRIWHITRWLPALAPLHPRGWLAGAASASRSTLLGAGIGLAATVLLLAFLSASFRGGLPGTNSVEAQAKEEWQFVAVGALNVRAEPHPYSQIVGALYPNQRVLVEGRKKGWARISVPERGYVAARFLQDQPAP